MSDVNKFVEVKRKTRWTLTGNAPKCPDDLDFVCTDSNGFINWWNVTPPKTDYWHVHEMLGRAYAFNLLDLINNPDGKYPPHIVAYITNAMINSNAKISAGALEGMTAGFFGALSEYLITGTCNR